MKIKSRPLNIGELFPCSFSRAKNVFKETDVFLNFSYTSRGYGTFANTPDAFYLKNNVKGKIIASMYTFPGNDKPLLNFFCIKATEYDDFLKQQFEIEILPSIFGFYSEILQKNAINHDTFVFLVELIDGCLKTHRYTFK